MYDIVYVHRNFIVFYIFLFPCFFMYIAYLYFLFLYMIQWCENVIKSFLSLRLYYIWQDIKGAIHANACETNYCYQVIKIRFNTIM